MCPNLVDCAMDGKVPKRQIALTNVILTNGFI